MKMFSDLNSGKIWADPASVQRDLRRFGDLFPYIVAYSFPADISVAAIPIGYSDDREDVQFFFGF